MNHLRAILRSGSIVVVMGATDLLLEGYPSILPGTIALLYLAIILLVAAFWHVRQGLFATLVGTLCFLHFLPPQHSMRVTGERHWIELIVFVATALSASLLSHRIQSAAAAANRRREETERLYGFIQKMLAFSNVEDLLHSIPRSLNITFQFTSTLLYLAADDRFYGDEGAPRPAAAELRAALDQPLGPGPDHSSMYVPLRAGIKPLGILVLAGTWPARETLEAIASLITLGINRATAMEQMARSEASRGNEWLRGVLLNSFLREMRRPVLELESATSSQDYSKAASAAASLHQILDDAVNMAQQDSSLMGLKAQPNSMRRTVEEALAERQLQLADRNVEVDLLERTHLVQMDSFWIGKVLGYLLENAVKYSPAGSPIAIQSEERAGNLYVTVTDRGIGIAPEEHERIFQNERRAPRSGMGLSIARAIVEAHGGALEVASSPGHGSAFTFSLPLAPESEFAPAV